ncbi:MAG TPA: alpha/beta hydrolase [Jatrophihabitantaceae bacterium]
MRVLAAAVILLVSLIAPASAAPSHRVVSTPPAPTAQRTPALTGTHPCPDNPGFACSTLRVPLDHRQPGQRSLDLAVAVEDKPAARHVLLFLTGGPGQPGLPFLSRVTNTTASLPDYRLAMIDQRGTGANALQCPELQDVMGSTDLAVPTPQDVRDCAAAIGPDRRLYGTADTVADLDDLRASLGVDRISLDGVSYGTYVAERYAITYPRRVDKLVLDSVVPDTGAEPLSTTPMSASARVLREVCAARTCPGDPVAELAATVRRRTDGSEILNALTILGIVDPDYTGVPELLHDAANGNFAHLDGLIAGVHQGSAATPEELSQGLHASTICADLRWPWGTSAAPLAVRKLALRAAVARLPESAVYPYDRRTAYGNGLAQTCLYWPDAPVPHPAGHLPHVPTLLLGGDRDLSTPNEWLRAVAARIPGSQVVIVPGAGHSVQTRAANAPARAAVQAFLRS